MKKLNRIFVLGSVPLVVVGFSPYKDTVVTGDNDRLAITNQTLRKLSGTNYLLIEG